MCIDAVTLNGHLFRCDWAMIHSSHAPVLSRFTNVRTSVSIVADEHTYKRSVNVITPNNLLPQHI